MNAASEQRDNFKKIIHEIAESIKDKSLDALIAEFKELERQKHLKKKNNQQWSSSEIMDKYRSIREKVMEMVKTNLPDISEKHIEAVVNGTVR